MDKYIAYYRVSTKMQGDSGLGIEAQQRQVRSFVKGKIISEHTEVESGKRNDRPVLKTVMEECRAKGAILVIAKLDRLSRNATFISHLLDSGVPFLCVDMPSVTPMVMRILGAVAQEEREMISKRTKDALKSLKERGVKLGNPMNNGWKKASEASAKSKKDRAAHNPNTKVASAYAKTLRSQGLTLNGIVEKLNEGGFRTPKGLPFNNTTQVLRLI